MGHLCPPGSGSGFRIRIRIHWPDWIRIQSGSETLIRAPLNIPKLAVVSDSVGLHAWPRPPEIGRYTRPHDQGLLGGTLIVINERAGDGMGDTSGTLWGPYVHIHQICTLWKKVMVFPVPSEDVTNQTFPGRELSNYSRPGRVWLVTSRLGTVKTIIVFYSVEE